MEKKIRDKYQFFIFAEYDTFNKKKPLLPLDNEQK